MDERTHRSSAGLTPEPEASAGLDSLWRQFGKAASEKEFCRAWLSLQCHAIPGVTGGVVLLGDPAEDRPYSLVASWPEGQGDFKHLAGVAERALKERRGLALKGSPQENGAPARPRYDIAYPIDVVGRLLGVVALDIDPRPEPELREAMRQLQWGSAWIEILSHRQAANTKDDAPLTRLQTVIQLLATAVSATSFHGAAVAVVTAVATRFGCDRVSVGFLKRGSIRTEAMSHTGQFGQDTNLVRAIDAAMNEAFDQETSVVIPEIPERKAVAARAHTHLAQESGNGALCSILLRGRDDIAGVLTLERITAEPFDDETILICESLGGLLGPILETHRRDDRWLIYKVLVSGKAALGALIGPSHVAAKLITAAVIALAVFLSTAKGTYRVTSDTVLEPSTRQAVTTIYDGYIRTAPLRAGDIVRKGDELATLEDHEYQLERTRWLSQQDQSQRQYHEALGNGNAAQAQVYSAQVAQARAQVALLDEQIAHTRITSPLDGVVVTGDLSQSLGAPVQRGQLLFEIAPLASYRVILKVDERDIADLVAGQHGLLVLSGSPNDPLPFEVHRITPVSTTSDGRNYFRVEARLESAPERLRPGMEGIGKVEIDTRPLVWIWTHQPIDWLRMKIWNWLP